MFTPQQIEQIAFDSSFYGYKKSDVDEFLEPLTEDYITLYKENDLLKSRLKSLQNTIAEYRKNAATMNDAMVSAQKTCDMMVREAEAKCAAMLGEANDAAAQTTKNTDALIAAENARVEEARRLADAKIQEIMSQMQACMTALERIRESNAPAEPVTTIYNYDREEEKSAPPPIEIQIPVPETPVAENTTDDVAEEISASLQALVGTAEEPAPKPQPKHPVSDTTGKFANLKFGRNYEAKKD